MCSTFLNENKAMQLGIKVACIASSICFTIFVKV